MTTEVTIYEKNGKMYCPDCKPQGSERGTLMTSAYGHYCAGCGEDLKEIGEAQQEVKEFKIVWKTTRDFLWLVRASDEEDALRKAEIEWLIPSYLLDAEDITVLL